jgi:murein DD-endopeptidase MepM/ murein hydrolase activator NlpD
VAEQPVGSWDDQAAQWYSEYGYAIDVAGPATADFGQPAPDGPSSDGYWDGAAAGAAYPYPDATSSVSTTPYDPNAYQPGYPDQASSHTGGYEQQQFGQPAYDGFGQPSYHAAPQDFGSAAPAWDAPAAAYPRPDYPTGATANGLAGLGLTDDGLAEFDFGGVNLSSTGLGGLGLEDVDLGLSARGGQAPNAGGYPEVSRYPAPGPVEPAAYQPYPSDPQPEPSYLIPHQVGPEHSNPLQYQGYAPQPVPEQPPFSADGYRQPEYPPPYPDLNYPQQGFADAPDYADHPHDAFSLPDYAQPQAGYPETDSASAGYPRPDYVQHDYATTGAQFDGAQFDGSQYGDVQVDGSQFDGGPSGESQYAESPYDGQYDNGQYDARYGQADAPSEFQADQGPAELTPSVDAQAGQEAVAEHPLPAMEQDADQDDDQPAAARSGERIDAVRPAPRTARARRSRSGVLGVVGPPAAVVGAAAVAVAVVGGLSMSDAKGVTNTASGDAKNTASPLNNQISALREEASAVAGRASRDQERVSLAQQQAQTLLAAQKRAEALRPKFLLPIQGPYTLTAGFGQASSLWANLHTGQDFAVPTGTSVHAVFDGTVTEAGWLGPYGYAVVITAKDGTQTWYCHLSQIKVRSGPVKAGEVIALSGATGNVTGPHLHLEVRIDGTPINPLPWLRQHGLDP